MVLNNYAHFIMLGVLSCHTYGRQQWWQPEFCRLPALCVLERAHSEGGSAYSWGGMALGAEGTEGLVSADFVTVTHVLLHICLPTSFVHLFLFIQILLCPRPLTLKNSFLFNTWTWTHRQATLFYMMIDDNKSKTNLYAYKLVGTKRTDS